MSGKKRAIETDWAKVDAYVLGPKDYEEIPEQTDEDFARGVLHIGGVPVPRGRPKSARPKQPVSLRLDADVIAHFRRSGRGWQSRINSVLRKAAKLPAQKRRKA
ncbi:MAG: BrnA antitoxin family protein [Xanthobacteraceae bacterium]